MALFHDWPGMFIITLLCLLGWFSGIVMGQFYISETISGSVSFPDLGLTCLGNLAVFLTSFIRGRLYWEIGAKDLLATFAAPKLKNIPGLGDTDGFGLTTCEDRQSVSDCSVVMLSKESPTSSMTQFVEYIANVYNVRSVILRYFYLCSPPLPLNVENCRDENCGDTCSCIVFSTGTDESIIKMLARQIPGTIKRLSDSRGCLLPSARCLINGCHGCKIVENDVLREGHSQVENDVLRDGQSQVEPPAAVCELLDILFSFSRIGEPGSCMCIPLRPKAEDDWTELLITSFKCKDDITQRGLLTRQYVTSGASRALENYMAGSGQCDAEDEYGTASVIVPRLVEILINLLLTFWFKLDAFSSALVSRKAIRQYIVDDNGRGFAASAFMTRARVISNANNNNVCQALYFRGNLLTLRTLAFIVACVNLICFVSWTVLVGLEGSANNWYHNHSVSPSKLRVVVIMVAIVIALCMDGIDLYLLRRCPESPPGPLPHWQRQLQRQQNLPDLRYRQAALQQQLLLVQELEQLLRLLQEQEEQQPHEQPQPPQEEQQPHEQPQPPQQELLVQVEQLLRLLQEQEEQQPHEQPQPPQQEQEEQQPHEQPQPPQQEQLQEQQPHEPPQPPQPLLRYRLQLRQPQSQQLQLQLQRLSRLQQQQLQLQELPQLQHLPPLPQVQELQELEQLLRLLQEQQRHEQLQRPLWLQLQRLMEQQLLPKQQQRLREQQQELRELLQEEHQLPQQGQPTLPNKRKKIMVYTMIILEIIYIVLGIVIAKTMGVKSFGRWAYTILQSFVWVKWGIGSFLLGHYSPWFLKIRFGMYVYSSAFLLNAILAGVQAKWEYS